LFRTALTPVQTASITRSAVIYRGKVTAEQPLDDVGKDVSNVWNERKYPLFEFKVTFTCTKRLFWTLPYTPTFPLLPIRELLQSLIFYELS